MKVFDGDSLSLTLMSRRFLPKAFVDVIKMVTKVIGHVIRDTFLDDVVGLRIKKKQCNKYFAQISRQFFVLTPSVFLTRMST